MEKKKRDYNIDFFRGLAALSIILIHTAFWSGSLYLKPAIQSLFLILDVPAFIFISGMTFHYSESVLKTIKNLIKIWKKYIVFILFYFLLVFILDRNNFNIRDIYPALFFKIKEPNVLPVVMGSMWFMFMFISVNIISSIIITSFNKYANKKSDFKYILLFLFFIYGIGSYYTGPYNIINQEITFYTLIYCLGYYFYKEKINLKKYLGTLVFISLIILIFFRGNNPISFGKMQDYKAKTHIIYLIYSFISLSTITYFKDRIKIKDNNPINLIGTNALELFFIQGISSSLIYYLYPFIANHHWLIKLITMAVFNLSLALTIFIIYLYIKENYYKKAKNFIIKKLA